MRHRIKKHRRTVVAAAAILAGALAVSLTPMANAVPRPWAASVSDFHVSPSGSDDNPGTSGAPFATVQHALDTAKTGDTVNLASGTYRQDFVTRRPGVTITGPKSAVVKGGGGARIIQVHHDRTVLTGFTVDGLHGDPDQLDGYRDKLIYVISTIPGEGVDKLRITNMTLTNGGGECMRLRYLITKAEIAHNTITGCGVHDYVFNDGGKNGEAIYLGTAPEQQGKNGAPDDRPDVSRDNWIHHNVIDTQGNECVDIKENSTANLVEYNDCTGQLDDKSAGLDARGSGNVFRYNHSYNNLGAGVRLGGDTETDGIDNDVYGNVLYGNGYGAIKFIRHPQGLICDNEMYDNEPRDYTGTFGSQYDPAATC